MGSHKVYDLYRAVPLDPHKGNIRVLDLLPGKWRQTVRVNLRVADVAFETDFEALSYTWGRSKRNRTLIVDGHHCLHITDNLFNALRRLRSTSKTRRLWVDAVCINQDDHEEKNLQVALMGQIYHSATCVNVWLGEPDIVFPVSLWPLITLFNERESRYSFATLRCKLLNHDGMLNSAIRNSLPSWYMRAWVVQEFILARKVYMCYGRHRTLYTKSWLNEVASPPEVYNGDIWNFRPRRWKPPKWKHTIDLTKHLQRRFEQLRTFREYQPLTELADPSARPPLGILEAAHCMREASATNPRDKVYSILGLIDQREVQLVGFDYSISCAELFGKATFASMKVRGDLDVLVLRKLNAEASSGLPSWAVDFTNHDPNGGYVFNQPVSSSLHFSATSMDSSYLRLSLSGAMMGKIADTFEMPCSHKRNFMHVPTAPAIKTCFFTLARDAATPFTCNKEDPGDTESGSSLLLRALRSNAASIVGSDLQRILPTWDEAAQQKTSDLREDILARNVPVPTSVKARVIYDDVERSGENAVAQPPSLSLLESGFYITTGTRDHDSVLDDLCRALQLHSWAVTQESLDDRDVNRMCAKLINKDAPFRPRLVEYLDYVKEGVGEVSIFATSNGLFGLAPATIVKGDIIVLARSSAPFLILRPQGEFYEFRGFAYIHGLMDQDCWDHIAPLDVPVQRYTLI